ncbi:MAG: creatininase family protein [Candidatus Aminicenantes bacterium]|nr:creatininase family protein [Candidatus Aminicenantes bacterium]
MDNNQRKIITVVLFIFLAVFVGNAQDVNPLFQETKIKNYIPHMTWKEFEEALQRTDMALIPVGSVEQHGKHLPLGTDFYGACETAKLISQEVDILVAPVLFLGLAEYHTGFPGTMTLTPETFEAVLYESALSLIKHGIKKIAIYNGHGGNNVSVDNVVRKINHTTEAAAIKLNNISLPPQQDPFPYPPYDWHAGISETSLMLYLTHSLVDMSLAEKPVLSIPPAMQKAISVMKEPSNLDEISSAYMFTPKKTGKKGSTREMTSNGVFSTGDPKDARTEYGKKDVEHFIQAAVKFLREWKDI